MNRKTPGDNVAYDLLTVGELLVDFISTEPVDTLASARTFERHQGGSPANIAVNVARLGGRSAMMANVGDDALGTYLIGELDRAGVDTTYVTRDPAAHTSVVFVARTTSTPDFLAMRAADYRLGIPPMPGAPAVPAVHGVGKAVSGARAVHTSTWPLSREPARATACEAMRLAHKRGKLTSLDPNYSPEIWPDRDEALAVLESLLPDIDIVKPSQDDAARLFDEVLAPEATIARFHAMGPRIVLYTMGAKGMVLSVAGDRTFIPARDVDVIDATGAGDAFWAGFLTATLDDLKPTHAAYVARELVARKLRTVGPLPGTLDRQALYREAQAAMDAREAMH
ncbi:MAG: carbohydrate kinase family protein [Anaerolineae bacterium]